MAFKLFEKTTLALMVSKPIKTSMRNSRHTVQAQVFDSGTTKVTALTLSLQASMKGDLTCPASAPTLAVGSTANYVKTGTFNYTINGTSYNKTTVAAGTAPTDLETSAAITGQITGSKIGGLLFYVNTIGTIGAKIPGKAVDSLQAYSTAAACHTALDVIQTEYAEWCYIGRIIVSAAGGGFTFGTTDFTGVTIYYDATLPWMELAPYALSAADIASHTAIFHVADRPAEYIRAAVTAVTGAGSITLRYSQGETY